MNTPLGREIVIALKEVHEMVKSEPTVDTREGRAALRAQYQGGHWNSAELRMHEAFDLLDARDEVLAAAEARIKSLLWAVGTHEKQLTEAHDFIAEQGARIAALEARLAEREGR